MRLLLIQTLIIALSFKTSVYAAEDDGIVSQEKFQLTLSLGAIEGRKIVTEENTTAYVFLGIPYAEPASGPNRYRPPVPKSAWNGTLQATEYGPPCVGHGFGQESMREDCLRLNVYTTPNCLKRKDCPIIFYTYGGAWQNNQPVQFQPAFLADNWQSKDIVLVTYSYRLSSLGYFTTVTKSSAVRNAAMLDKLEGLRWTRREAEWIGGDKEKITIMGHSSGSVDTDYLSMSPLTKGLFNQIVLMSGPAGMHQHLTKDNNVEASKRLAIDAGCTTEEAWDDGKRVEEMIECLRKVPLHDLLQLQAKHNFIGPVIDDNDEGVLPVPLKELLRNREPHPIMAGTTSKEFRISHVVVDEKHGGKVNRILLFAFCLLASNNENYTHPVAVAMACSRDYLEREEDIPDLSDDQYIYVPNYDTTQAVHSKGQPAYQYSFEYEHIGDAYGKSKLVEPPFHAQDLVYVMGMYKNRFSKKDLKIADIYSGMFSSFVKTGDPSPPGNSWKTVGSTNSFYKIDFDDQLNVPGNTDGYHQDAVNFWRGTAPKLDATLSNYEDNGTINMKTVLNDMVEQLRKIGKPISKVIKAAMKRSDGDWNLWSPDTKAEITALLDDVIRVLTSGPKKEKGRKHQGRGENEEMIEAYGVQSARKLLPVVLAQNASVTVSPESPTSWSTPSEVEEPTLAPINCSTSIIISSVILVVLVVLLMATCFLWVREKKINARHKAINPTETTGLLANAGNRNNCLG